MFKLEIFSTHYVFLALFRLLKKWNIPWFIYVEIEEPILIQLYEWWMKGCILKLIHLLG